MLNLGHINVFYSKTPKDNSITFDLCTYYASAGNILYLTYANTSIKSIPLSPAKVKMIKIDNNLDEILDNHTFRVDLIIIDEIWCKSRTLTEKDLNLLKRLPISIILNVGENVQKLDYSKYNHFIYHCQTREKKLIEDKQTNEKHTIEQWKKIFLRDSRIGQIFEKED